MLPEQRLIGLYNAFGGNPYQYSDPFGKQIKFILMEKDLKGKPIILSKPVKDFMLKAFAQTGKDWNSKGNFGKRLRTFFKRILGMRNLKACSGGKPVTIRILLRASLLRLRIRLYWYRVKWRAKCKYFMGISKYKRDWFSKS